MAPDPLEADAHRRQRTAQDAAHVHRPGLAIRPPVPQQTHELVPDDGQERRQHTQDVAHQQRAPRRAHMLGKDVRVHVRRVGRAERKRQTFVQRRRAQPRRPRSAQAGHENAQIVDGTQLMHIDCHEHVT